jgi:hypothetical protein
VGLPRPARESGAIYIAGPPFCSFPYLFGYPFSTGVYQQREQWGRESAPTFWTQTIVGREKRVAHFEALAAYVSEPCQEQP